MAMPGGALAGLGGGPFGRFGARDDTIVSQPLRPGTFRRMVRFARPHRRQIVAFLVVIAIDAGVSNVGPLIWRSIINDGIRHQDKGLILELTALAAGLALADAALTLLQTFLSARVGQRVLFDMRSQVFAHVQRMPIAFFTRTQTGALISRLNNDVAGAQQAVTTTLGSVVSNIINLAIVLGLMLSLSWQITVAVLVLFPVFFLPTRWVGRKLRDIARENYVLLAALNATMTERFNVSGALLVKLFGDPDRERATFDGDAARLRDVGVRQAVYGRVFFVGMLLLTSLSTAAVYGIGGILVVERTIDIGTLVALTAYLARLYGPITQLSNAQVDVMTALVSFDRIFELLDLEPMVDERPGAVSVPPGGARIELDHVDFRYPAPDEVSLASLEAIARLDRRPDRPVLHDVSFVVEPGQMVALVGPSGAGKTTISHLVPRLYDVTGGAIRINGVDVRDVTLASLRDTVGVVTQDAHLFHDTIRANLQYAKAGADDAELLAALDAARLRELVESLPEGLDTVVGDRGYRFSGGEKQRLAIARLLLKAPRIVVLDEATAHLDTESEAAVQAALATALEGRTSLVIAHRLSTVRHADLLLVVAGGRIVERGTHEELLAAGGLYTELHGRLDDGVPG